MSSRLALVALAVAHRPGVSAVRSEAGVYRPAVGGKRVGVMDTAYSPAFPKVKKYPKQGLTDGYVLDQVRVKCRLRDDPCVVNRLPHPELVALIQKFGPCEGKAQLMHLFGHRQSATRRMAPHERHDSKWCARGCTRHHIAEEREGLRFAPHTEDGMDGSFGWHAEPPKVHRARGTL